LLEIPSARKTKKQIAVINSGVLRYFFISISKKDLRTC
jgi:hypothetical protein